MAKALSAHVCREGLRRFAAHVAAQGFMTILMQSSSLLEKMS